jgi:hypothetical protein
MKRLPVLIAFCSLSLLVGAPATEAPTAIQQQAIQQQVEQVLVVAKEVQVQQAAIAENQVKIDAKLATIAENIRVARIYSTRAK